MTAIAGWGRYPVVDTELATAWTAADAQLALARGDGLIARGNGRAYGDAAIGDRSTLAMTKLDRFRNFDPGTGTLVVEAGALLDDVIRVFGPRGYFPYVVPGTRFVTVGGAIAADVHGKNHHRDGGFGNYVDSLLLATPGGDVVRASRVENPELFAATVGGMGLTGIILEAAIRLKPIQTGWIRQHTIAAPNLAAAIRALSDADAATYSVAWIDGLATGGGLGRSLVFVGEHATRDELSEAAASLPYPPLNAPRLRVPMDLPGITLNRWSVGAFNALYATMGARKAGRSVLVRAEPYFFPLDGIHDWNRIYGRAGFVQHQCVLPVDTAPGTLAEMLARIAARGDASFLAVLKKLGAGGGLLSFPMAGYTLALDFRMKPGLLAFLDELDRLVVAAGGRLYLAKDARQSPATFEAGYPALDRFRAIRRSVDPKGRLRSHLAQRLGI